MNPVVHAVMRATIEVPVRASASGETLETMHKIAKTEAYHSLRDKLEGTGCRIIGEIEFSHAIIKEIK